MLFLLNDVVFTLEPPSPAPLKDERRFAPLELDSLIELGCELFSEHPQLQRTHPERARRLAWLLSRKTEGLNAALFTAPEAGCLPEVVEPRFCALPLPTLDQLYQRAIAGQSLSETTERDIWGLVAA
ncbi:MULTISPECIES: hypothetical protein [unclassified Brevundimonas]|uniref:hypothetical protein n=1 Tax=unclassified Brevundimonas TaxID=2622653 RepID=UPI0025BF9A42|nr:MULTISPECIES: hypothetical protein [unclassified Brevundimonas]